MKKMKKMFQHYYQFQIIEESGYLSKPIKKYGDYCITDQSIEEDFISLLNNLVINVILPPASPFTILWAATAKFNNENDTIVVIALADNCIEVFISENNHDIDFKMFDFFSAVNIGGEEIEQIRNSAVQMY